jgi:A/G-specific adenine glycosylase
LRAKIRRPHTGQQNQRALYKPVQIAYKHTTIVAEMVRNKKQQQFIDTVWEYYKQHARHDMPWRQSDNKGTFDVYHILVSEVMLQQTQVSRVMDNFPQFLQKFPTASHLADAPLAEVLIAWQGLGYNRRAQYLHMAAQRFRTKKVWNYEDLVACKGIGANTAAAVVVYAYNTPRVFIETNIRTVFIHHFFPERTDVHDKELLPIISATLSKELPREWYWALMDYGSHLKKTVGNTARRSKHYAKQSPFEGSARQLRGKILRQLITGPKSSAYIKNHAASPLFSEVINALIDEGLVLEHKKRYSLAE